MTLLFYNLIHACGIFLFHGFKKIHHSGCHCAVSKFNVDDIAHLNFAARLGWFIVDENSALHAGVLCDSSPLYQS